MPARAMAALATSCARLAASVPSEQAMAKANSAIASEALTSVKLSMLWLASIRECSSSSLWAGVSFMSRFSFFLVASAMLTGCAAPKPVQVRVPLPVACTEQVPERPEMPSESLQPGVSPWVLLRAALAEIDRREGYEQVMRAALVACTAPLR